MFNTIVGAVAIGAGAAGAVGAGAGAAGAGAVGAGAASRYGSGSATLALGYSTHNVTKCVEHDESAFFVGNPSLDFFLAYTVNLCRHYGLHVIAFTALFK
jgi:hypothetical protein